MKVTLTQKLVDSIVDMVNDPYEITVKTGNPGGKYYFRDKVSKSDLFRIPNPHEVIVPAPLINWSK